MPAQFMIHPMKMKTVLRELRNLDQNLVKTMRDEFRTDLKPVLDRLKSGIPKRAPLSGFNKRGSTTKYRWTAVSGRIAVSLGKRARRDRAVGIVSMKFSSRAKAAGFEILELAGSKTQGRTPQGRGMIRALRAVAPVQKGLGRFVIPQAKSRINETRMIAGRIVKKFIRIVNRRIS